MNTITDWNGKEVECGRSKGGVIAVSHPFENLIRTAVEPWPPAEIVQKMYKSRAERAFVGENSEAVTRKLEYYCDLQSMHSEDAMTWNVFGPVKYAEKEARRRFAGDLFGLLGRELESDSEIEIWLWRRIPHPDTLVSGGPEIDFGIATEQIIVLGEAKWLSHVGQNQGKKKDKDQIDLRAEFAGKLGRAIFGENRHLCILGLSLNSDVVGNKQHPAGDSGVSFHDLTWDEVGSLQSHPQHDELKRYFEWKLKHSNL